ncbi:hypothetical protein B0H16DRAFT_1538381 [Mycena metata]|uniref:Uncharacterized protein n=1 Tax=Mycena metata TaxID=1033252 RepID=A0AAD7J5D1_9AGAR|nr:hypothetical protein B0H16DRAFT_1538381 [Mycena metata]
MRGVKDQSISMLAIALVLAGFGSEIGPNLNRTELNAAFRFNVRVGAEPNAKFSEFFQLICHFWRYFHRFTLGYILPQPKPGTASGLAMILTSCVVEFSTLRFVTTVSREIWWIHNCNTYMPSCNKFQLPEKADFSSRSNAFER